MDFNYEEFVEKNKGKKIASISCELEGDTETPISLFNKLCKTSKVFLLESVEGGNRWGRFSYIGRKPFMEIIAYDDNITIKKENGIIKKEGDPLRLVQEVLDDYRTEALHSLESFVGGAVGHIGYDLIKNIHGVKNQNKDHIGTPDLHLLFPEEIIAYDHLRQKIKLIINLEPKDSLEKTYNHGLSRLETIQKEISEEKTGHKGINIKKSNEINGISNESKESFMAKVVKAKEYIEEKQISQVVLSQRFSYQTEISPFEAYRKLRALNPSPYMYYIDFGTYHLVGSSPETLVKIDRGKVETCPIAGTRPRGRDEKEDEMLARELLEDEKEVKEHLMLVDLSKDDMRKISEEGTIEVEKLMEVQKYSHVMHLVSHVRARMKKGLKQYDIIKHCGPAGTVSGTPKLRALEIIEELENERRGIYAGAVGYLSFDENMDVCITIRTIIFKDGMAYIQAGGGIVADSTPQGEYDESIRKARALVECI